MLYYVVKKNDDLSNYHYIFSGEHAFKKAKTCAENLKLNFGHQYEVIKVETVWHTQTLAEIMEEF